MYAKRYRRPAPIFGADALAVMRAHAWPGNVRELEHWVESAVVLAPDGRIGAAHLPRLRPSLTVATPGVLGITLDEAARRHAVAMVDACAGNKAEAARRLAIGRNTLGRLLRGETAARPPDARATRRSAG